MIQNSILILKDEQKTDDYGIMLQFEIASEELIKYSRIALSIFKFKQVLLIY